MSTKLQTTQPRFSKIITEKPNNKSISSRRKVKQHYHIQEKTFSDQHYKGNWQDQVFELTKLTDCGHREAYIASYSDGRLDFVIALEQEIGFQLISLCKKQINITTALYRSANQETGVFQSLNLGGLIDVKLYHISKKNFNQAFGVYGLEYHPADALLPTYTYEKDGLSVECTRAYKKLKDDPNCTPRVLMEGKSGGDYSICFLITYQEGYHEFLGKKNTGAGDNFLPKKITKELLEKYAGRETRIRYGEIFGKSIVWDNKTHLVTLKWVPKCNVKDEPGFLVIEDGHETYPNIGYAGFDELNHAYLRFNSSLEKNEHCCKLEDLNGK